MRSLRALLAASVLALPGLGAQSIAHGRVLTDTLWSPALGVKKAVVVYLPPSYDADRAKRYPVAYYLHGAFGDETNWSTQGRIQQAMDSLVAVGTPEMILVMPDGDDGWYTTWNVLITADQCKAARFSKENPATYCVPWGHYDDYIAHDLVQWTDARYRTIADRAHRGIAGLSMGGYGAITLAFGYPERFAAAASHSGVLSPLYVGTHPFRAPPRYAAGAAPVVESAWSKSLLTVPSVFGRDSASWWSRDPAQKLRRLKASGGTMPALFVDAGTEDALFVDQSRAFRWEAERAGVPIIYHEWPGGHDWVYWRTHVGESLAFLAGVIAK
jgi:enterochelin esterase-like enzyme